MLSRQILDKTNYLLEKFPIVSITGPRQSGKTTFIKNFFPGYRYFNLEMPDVRQLAISDPKSFLQSMGEKAILDEIQHVPELFSYIQGISDERNKVGQYILSGSQNFLLLERISQSLAGRVAIIKLLPFSLNEIGSIISNYTLNELMVNGMYPRIYDKQIAPADFYPNYLQTYVERDVQLIRNITNQNQFIKFIGLCAGRAGQILNYAALANDAGISVPTLKEWLSILEASYVIYFLHPHHLNYNKRLIKMPKLYFYDTGLLSNLLGIQQANQYEVHFAKGAIFENFVINDIIKQEYNEGIVPAIYYWRDKNGHEIDLILEKNGRAIPIEIKSGSTISTEYFKNLKYYHGISGGTSEPGYVIYAGETSFQLSEGSLSAWTNLPRFVNKLI